MASILKILGQQKPAATTLTVLDAVPVAKAHVVSSLTICNQSGVDDHFRVAVAVGGAADDAKQYVYYDELVPAGETFISTIGLTLAATDELRCYSTNGSCVFNAFGTEES